MSGSLNVQVPVQVKTAISCPEDCRPTSPAHTHTYKRVENPVEDLVRMISKGNVKAESPAMAPGRVTPSRTREQRPSSSVQFSSVLPRTRFLPPSPDETASRLQAGNSTAPGVKLELRLQVAAERRKCFGSTGTERFVQSCVAHAQSNPPSTHARSTKKGSMRA